MRDSIVADQRGGVEVVGTSMKNENPWRNVGRGGWAGSGTGASDLADDSQ